MVYISDSRGKLICDGCLEGRKEICKERGRSEMVTGEGTGHLLERSEWWVGCGCGDISRSGSRSSIDISHSLCVCTHGF